jgi:hypothetical protein
MIKELEEYLDETSEDNDWMNFPERPTEYTIQKAEEIIEGLRDLTTFFISSVDGRDIRLHSQDKIWKHFRVTISIDGTGDYIYYDNKTTGDYGIDRDVSVENIKKYLSNE